MKLSNAHTETPTYGILHSAIVAKGVVTVVLTGVGLGERKSLTLRASDDDTTKKWIECFQNAFTGTDIIPQGTVQKANGFEIWGTSNPAAVRQTLTNFSMIGSALMGLDVFTFHDFSEWVSWLSMTVFLLCAAINFVLMFGVGFEVSIRLVVSVVELFRGFCAAGCYVMLRNTSTLDSVVAHLAVCVFQIGFAVFHVFSVSLLSTTICGMSKTSIRAHVRVVSMVTDALMLLDVVTLHYFSTRLLWLITALFIGCGLVNLALADEGCSCARFMVSQCDLFMGGCTGVCYLLVASEESVTMHLLIAMFEIMFGFFNYACNAGYNKDIVEAGKEF